MTTIVPAGDLLAVVSHFEIRAGDELGQATCITIERVLAFEIPYPGERDANPKYLLDRTGWCTIHEPMFYGYSEAHSGQQYDLWTEALTIVPTAALLTTLQALATPEEMIAHAIAEKWIAEETETDGTALYYPGNNRPA